MGLFIRSKLSKHDKLDIYNYWNNYGNSINEIAYTGKADINGIAYLIFLLDRYGVKILDKK